MHSWHSGENGSSQLTGDWVRIVNNPVENLKRCDKFSKRLLRKVKQERIYHKWDITHKTIFYNLKAAWQSVFHLFPGSVVSFTCSRMSVRIFRRKALNWKNGQGVFNYSPTGNLCTELPHTSDWVGWNMARRVQAFHLRNSRDFKEFTGNYVT